MVLSFHRSSPLNKKGDFYLIIILMSIFIMLISPIIFDKATSTIICFLTILIITLFIYYTIMIGKDIFLSYAFFPYLVLLIQTTIYPAFVLLFGKQRLYLFDNYSPDYIPAIFIWALSVLGFGLGIIKRKNKPRLENRISPDYNIDRFSGYLDIKFQELIMVSMPLILISILSSYIIFKSYGLDLRNDFINIGIFSSDSIRRNRGLGPLMLFEKWSYVAVAYVGWVAFFSKNNRGLKLLLGIFYSILGSILSIINARRGTLFYHLLLLFLPLGLQYFMRRKKLIYMIPIMLVIMIFVDSFTAEMRRIYYNSGHLIPNEAAKAVFNQEYAPLSYDHLELSAALWQQIKNGTFKPMEGQTFLAALLNFVPRRLWRNKLWTGGTYFSVAMGGAYYFDDTGISSGITTGLIVETMMNFGKLAIIFLPIIMFYVSYILSGFNWFKYAKRKNNIIALTCFSLFYFFSMDLFSDDLGSFVNKIITNLSGIMFITLISKLKDKK